MTETNKEIPSLKELLESPSDKDKLQFVRSYLSETIKHYQAEKEHHIDIMRQQHQRYEEAKQQVKYRSEIVAILQAIESKTQ